MESEPLVPQVVSSGPFKPKETRSGMLCPYLPRLASSGPERPCGARQGNQPASPFSAGLLWTEEYQESPARDASHTSSMNAFPGMNRTWGVKTGNLPLLFHGWPLQDWPVTAVSCVKALPHLPCLVCDSSTGPESLGESHTVFTTGFPGQNRDCGARQGKLCSFLHDRNPSAQP